MGRTASDYASSLLFKGFCVDRPGGSFGPVLFWLTQVLCAGTKVPACRGYISGSAMG